MSVFGVQHADIVNQAIDAIGWENTIGDLEEGTFEARIVLRHYAPSVEEILRAAPWNFARKQQLLTLLQDATASTAGAGTGTPGMGLWVYEYAWPIDCLHARYVPVTGNINPPTPPGNIQPAHPSSPTTTLPSPWPASRTLPAPFQVTTDMVPNVTGALTSWAQYPDLSGTQGQSLNQQTVILTNQQQASLVYTARIDDPNLWDPLFRQAIVQMLGAKLALPIWVKKDMKMAVAMQQACVVKAKAALDQARVADGNESWSSNVNRDAQWIKGRLSGGPAWWGAGAGGWGGGDYSLYSGWVASPFPDGSVY